MFFSESRLHEAGYFHAISQSSKFTVDFIQMSVKGKAQDQTMEQIQNLEPQVILLYSSKETIELLVQQVKTATGKSHFTRSTLVFC